MVKANKNESLGFLDNFFERNLYFKSKLLTVEGFQREQDYFIYKHSTLR